MELREKQKAEAIKRMKKFNIMNQTIKEFKIDDIVNLSENGGILFWLNDTQKEMVDKFEKENNATVYHVIHQYTNIGELYNLLFVSNYEEEWERDLKDIDSSEILAYVYNVDMPDCSEFGYIGVQPRIGGLMRMW